MTMQPSASQTGQRRQKAQTSCTECHRRKQKCVIPRHDQPCVNCAKRFPPVTCVLPQQETPDYDGQLLTLDLASNLSEIPSNASGFILARDRPGRSRTPARHSRSPAPRLAREKDKARREGSRSAQPPTVGRRADAVGLPPPYAKGLSVPGSAASPASTGSSPSPPLGDEQQVVALVIRSRERFVLDGRGDVSFIARFGGILTDINGLNSSWIANTTRNAQLLHFYLKFISPNFASIDGLSQANTFTDTVLPWQMQSPIFPTIGLLIAATTLALAAGKDITNNREITSLRARSFALINNTLTAIDSMAYGNDLIGSIVNLVVMEWFWGSKETMWMHLKGMREIIRIHKGFRNIARSFTDNVRARIIILTDYEIACHFEEDLYLLGGDPAKDDYVDIPLTWPVGFDSPSIPSRTTFESIAGSLKISPITAQILDDMRFLTSLVNSTPRGDGKKIYSTASWLHDKLCATTSDETSDSKLPAIDEETHHIQETVRAAAVMYSWAVREVAPLSKFDDAAIRKVHFEAMMAVSLSRWKQIPGIFLWVMQCASPGAGDDLAGRYIRRKMAVAGLCIGFEDFDLSIAYLRSFWRVQRWIAGADE